MKRSEEEQRKFKEKQAQRLEKQRKLLEKTGQQELKQKEAELMMQGAQRRAVGAEEGMEGEISPLWDEILNEEEVAGTLFLPSETSTEAEGQRGKKQRHRTNAQLYLCASCLVCCVLQVERL